MSNGIILFFTTLFYFTLNLPLERRTLSLYYHGNSEVPDNKSISTFVWWPCLIAVIFVKLIIIFNIIHFMLIYLQHEQPLCLSSLSGSVMCHLK